jgi:hypothetical protein
MLSSSASTTTASSSSPSAAAGSVPLPYRKRAKVDEGEDEVVAVASAREPAVGAIVTAEHPLGEAQPAAASSASASSSSEVPTRRVWGEEDMFVDATAPDVPHLTKDESTAQKKSAHVQPL